MTRNETIEALPGLPWPVLLAALVSLYVVLLRLAKVSGTRIGCLATAHLVLLVLLLPLSVPLAGFGVFAFGVCSYSVVVVTQARTRMAVLALTHAGFLGIAATAMMTPAVLGAAVLAFLTGLTWLIDQWAIRGQPRVVQGWTANHKAIVDGLVSRLVGDGTSGGDFRAELAAVTRCLPIYSDMGGLILLSPRGELMFVDSNTSTINSTTILPLNDGIWETVALCHAAWTYLELADLRPRRPAQAIDCEWCEGRGRIATIHDMTCGKCHGAGWVEL